MNALSSLKTSVTSLHESEYGMGEEIVYTHKESSLEETTYAVVEENEFNKLEGRGQETENVRADNITFANVKLDTPPKIDDKISYDSKEWDVMDFSKNIGLYTIYATSNARHSGRPSRRRV